MPDTAARIARIRLARSLPRLLAMPVALLVAGAGALAAGLLVVGGTVGLVLAVLGGAVALAGVVTAAVLLSVRLEVEEAAVGVSWLGGGRVYPLTSGPVTRVRLRGPSASRLRPRTGALGWALGRAILRDSEAIDVVRLASTPTVILIPTQRGRLAVAPAHDEDLLDALSRAARARQRLEALAAALPAPTEPAPPLETDAEEPPPEPEPEPPPEPRPLTGIERAMLERRLADEGSKAADMPTVEPEPPAAEVAPEPEVAVVPQVVLVDEPAARRRRRIALRRPRPGVAFVFLPLVGAGAAWAAGAATGLMPDPETDLGRLTLLALVMAGPATSVGAIMALAWWPRLVGVVVAGGLAASVFIGRSLLGP
jgi:hypothetical protein